MSTMQETTDRPEVLDDECAALNGWHRGITPELSPDDLLNVGPRLVAGHWAKAGKPTLVAEAIDAMIDGLPATLVEKVVATVEQLQDDYRSVQRCREGHESVVRRRRESLANAALAAAMDGYPATVTPEQLQDAVGRVIDARGPVVDPSGGDFTKSLDGAVASLADTHARGWLGLRLPSFPTLDGKLCGLRGLMLLGAAPGAGKTQLTVQLGTDVVLADPGVGLVYLSLEMSKSELAYRLLCMASKLSYRRLRLGDPAVKPGTSGLRLTSADADALERGRKQLEQMAQRIAMYGGEDIGLLEAGRGDPANWYRPLRDMVEDAKRRQGVKRALVVIDNLQAIAVEPPHGKPWASDLDRDRVVIEGLTRLQHDTDDAVLVVSEVAKGKFDDTSGQNAILGSGRNAYRADAVMLLKRRKDESDTADRRVDLIVDKGRDGMTRGTVALEWSDGYARLDEAAS